MARSGCGASAQPRSSVFCARFASPALICSPAKCWVTAMRSGASAKASRANASASAALSVSFGGAAALDQEHRLQRAALVGGDDLAPLAGLERLLRRLPLADLRLHVEQRMHHPRRLRLQLEGALGIGQRLGLIALAQRLADQAAQAEEGRVLVLQHGGEGAVGAVAVAGELGGLRRQQERDRRLGEKLLGLAGVLLRFGAVAGGDRGQPLRQLAIAALLAALAPAFEQGERRADDPAIEQPAADAEPDQHHERDQQHADAAVEPPALPFGGDRARPLGQPHGHEHRHGGDSEPDEDAQRGHRISAPSPAG